eukprot:356384-Chlamydomonas_euryale.AAC.1
MLQHTTSHAVICATLRPGWTIATCMLTYEFRHHQHRSHFHRGIGIKWACLCWAKEPFKHGSELQERLKKFKPAASLTCELPTCLLRCAVSQTFRPQASSMQCQRQSESQSGGERTHGGYAYVDAMPAPGTHDAAMRPPPARTLPRPHLTSTPVRSTEAGYRSKDKAKLCSKFRPGGQSDTVKRPKGATKPISK